MHPIGFKKPISLHDSRPAVARVPSAMKPSNAFRFFQLMLLSALVGIACLSFAPGAEVSVIFNKPNAIKNIPFPSIQVENISVASLFWGWGVILLMKRRRSALR
jgi:hypothetical protein